jgi:hypothetical protein
MHQQPYPPIPQKQPRRRREWPLLAGLGCGLPALVLAAIAAYSSVIGWGDDAPAATPAETAPPYRIVQQDDNGNARDVTVEVDTADRLNDVFNAVADSLTDPAGYFVRINCSTGGSSTADNRLAHGKVSVGQLGKATTGLDAGGQEFETNPGRDCPAK